MRTRKIKILLCLICFSLVFSFLWFSVKAKELEVNYPDLVGNAPPPTSTKTLLPAYVKYIFSLAIKISAIIAFLALIYGGFLFMTSTGNPGQLAEAKDQIFNAFLGLIILLSSYLLLNTLNPKLVILKNPQIEPTQLGIILYDVPNCGEGATSYNSKHLYSDTSFDGEPSDNPDNLNYWKTHIQSVKYFLPTNQVEVHYVQEDGRSISAAVINAPDCQNINFENDPLEKIVFYYHLSGVYVYKDENCTGDFLYLTSSLAVLPQEPSSWNDQIHCLQIVNPEPQEKARFVAVLHENEYFSGKCKEFVGTEESTDEALGETIYSGTQLGDLNGQASSITIFKIPTQARTSDGSDEGVFFFDDPNYQTNLIAIRGRKPDSNNQEEFPAHAYYDDPSNASSGISFNYNNVAVEISNLQNINANDKITSLKVTAGKYLTILWEDSGFSGKCEIFKDNISNLRSYDLGQCSCPLSKGWNFRTCDCASSLKVFQIK